MNTPEEQHAIRNAVTISLKHDLGFECAKVTCATPEIAERVKRAWSDGWDMDAIAKAGGRDVLVSYAKSDTKRHNVS
jgi:hypothetical protein